MAYPPALWTLNRLATNGCDWSKVQRDQAADIQRLRGCHAEIEPVVPVKQPGGVCTGCGRPFDPLRGQGSR